MRLLKTKLMSHEAFFHFCPFSFILCFCCPVLVVGLVVVVSVVVVVVVVVATHARYVFVDIVGPASTRSSLFASCFVSRAQAGIPHGCFVSPLVLV